MEKEHFHTTPHQVQDVERNSNVGDNIFAGKIEFYQINKKLNFILKKNSSE